MADRQVTQTGKTEDGDITTICNPAATWSPRSKAAAIAAIENDTHRHYVGRRSSQVDIHVVKDPDGKHLRTDPDKTDSNNLDELPDG